MTKKTFIVPTTSDQLEIILNQKQASGKSEDDQQETHYCKKFKQFNKLILLIHIL